MIAAWHWTNGDKLRDGSPLPPVMEWLEYTGKAIICVSGLHASRRVLDALFYAPGTKLHLVECEDIVAESSDKVVCRRRRIVKSAEMTDALIKWLTEFIQLHKWLFGNYWIPNYRTACQVACWSDAFRECVEKRLIDLFWEVADGK